MKVHDGISRRAVLRGGAAAAGGALVVEAAARSSARAADGRRDSISVAMPANPETIDPHQFRSIFTGSVLACCLETLLTRDPETMELRPLLATEWRNIDPLTWEF